MMRTTNRYWVSLTQLSRTSALTKGTRTSYKETRTCWCYISVASTIIVTVMRSALPAVVCLCLQSTHCGEGTAR